DLVFSALFAGSCPNLTIRKREKQPATFGLFGRQLLCVPCAPYGCYVVQATFADFEPHRSIRSVSWRSTAVRLCRATRPNTDYPNTDHLLFPTTFLPTHPLSTFDTSFTSMIPSSLVQVL